MSLNDLFWYSYCFQILNLGLLKRVTTNISTFVQVSWEMVFLLFINQYRSASFCSWYEHTWLTLRKFVLTLDLLGIFKLFLKDKDQIAPKDLTGRWKCPLNTLGEVDL